MDDTAIKQQADKLLEAMYLIREVEDWTYQHQPGNPEWKRVLLVDIYILRDRMKVVGAYFRLSSSDFDDAYDKS